MKYNNLDDIFYLEDLFIVWQAEQAKEKEYKNDKVDIRSFQEMVLLMKKCGPPHF